MIDGGVLDGLGVTAVVGCHVVSVLPTGLVGIRSGIAMSDAGPSRSTSTGSEATAPPTGTAPTP